MTISKKAMLVNLRIGIWVGQKQDKLAGEELTASKNAAMDAASVNMQLIPKEVLRRVI